MFGIWNLEPEISSAKPRAMKIFMSVVTAFVLLNAIDGFATDTYDYKKGELLVVKGGKSPDKKLAIVSGENKSGEFGIYLMDAQTKKIIGPLEEVATGLDTGPEAYRAHWSPDSKHVGISSRSDRHWMPNVIYRIENRRAFLVQTPELRCQAVPKFCDLAKELGGAMTEDEIYADSTEGKPWKMRQNSSYSEILKWISNSRFIVREEAAFQVRDRDPSDTLGEYGEVDPAEKDEPYYASFQAEGECELLPGDKARVISAHPVKKSEKE